MGAVNGIRTLAESLGYEFIYGTAEYVNAELTHFKDIQTKDVIYLVPTQNAGSYLNGVLDISTVNSILGLGVKNDGTYQSTLNETYEQKYDRRLANMETLLMTFIQILSCTDKYTMLSHRIFPEINKFDENIDVLMGEIQFEYEF